MRSSVIGVLVLVLSLLTAGCGKASAAASIPAPDIDEHGGPTADRIAVFAGGCFWGIEAVFEHIKGVKNAVSGYAGGTKETSQISYGQLLQVFFSAAHDPTQLNRQGPDAGPQYRSVIFFASPEQQRIAQAYIDQLNQTTVFKRSIVTRVEPLQMFYAAEAYHQDYAAHHPTDLYIVINDLPKVGRLREQFPQLYRGK